MSRVRNTLDTVSKAVSGTHVELLSKIAKLKPNAFRGGKEAEASVESAPKAEESAVPPILSTSTLPQPTSSSSSATLSIPTSVSTFDANATAATHSHNPAQVTVTATLVTVGKLKEKRLRCVVPAVKASSARKQKELKPSSSDLESQGSTSEQTTALFHPSTIYVSLDETYNYLAHHINSYFGSSTNDKKVDNVYSPSASSQGQQTSGLVPVPGKTVSAALVTPPSTKKGLGHYLSYSAPTVQAFVGSYIAPLVPRFRMAEYKSAAVEEKKSEDAPVQQIEVTIIKEQKTAEEKAKKTTTSKREDHCQGECGQSNSGSGSGSPQGLGCKGLHQQGGGPQLPSAGVPRDQWCRSQGAGYPLSAASEPGH